jgi:hypothetical protein
MAREHWSELSVRRRITILVVGTVQVGLSVAALVDLQRRPAAQVKGAKGWWRLAALTNTVGPLAYFLFGRKHDSGTVSSG